MQTLKLIFSLTIALLFSSCNSDTFEIDALTHDTINHIDQNGRQGRWIVHTDCAKGIPLPPQAVINVTDSGLATKNQTIALGSTSPLSILQIGNYINDKKQGRWTYYNEDGSVNKTEEFKDDLPIRN